FFFHAEDGIRDFHVTGVQTCALPICVPAEAAFDPLAPHRLVAGNDVLDVAGQQVAVVRQAVGERRAVVEDVLVVAVRARVPRLDGGLEGAVALPVRQNVPLQRGERRLGGDLVGGLVADGRLGIHPVCSSRKCPCCRTGRTRPTRGRPGAVRRTFRGTTPLARARTRGPLVRRL